MPIRLEDVERKADEARRAWETGRAKLVTPLYGVGIAVAQAEEADPEESAADQKVQGKWRCGGPPTDLNGQGFPPAPGKTGA